MFCSNCGNYCANMKFCPMCGTKVLEVEEAKKEQEDSYEIPYRSTYVSPASVHLDITKSFLAITKKVFFKKKMLFKHILNLPLKTKQKMCAVSISDAHILT